METQRPGRMSAPGISEPTEAIARARAGDAEAWGQLYREYAPAIFRFCRRAMPTREDVESVPLEHPEPSQLEKLIEQRSGEEVRKALEKMGARARMALVMRYYSDMSYDEIADALGVRRAFVGVVLLRARHELRQALEGNAALAAGGAS